MDRTLALLLIAGCSAGATHRGALEESDPVLRVDGSYYDAFEVEAGPGWTIRATLESEAFDAYLLLLDPEGALLAEDDGGAGGHDARLDVTVPVGGRYRVVATSFHGRTTGAYVLRLEARPGD